MLQSLWPTSPLLTRGHKKSPPIYIQLTHTRGQDHYVAPNSKRVEAPPLARQVEYQPRALPRREGRVVPADQRQQLADAAPAARGVRVDDAPRQRAGRARPVLQERGAVIVALVAIVVIRRAVRVVVD